MDFKSLRKMETTPYSTQTSAGSSSELVSVLVKVKKGHAPPLYVLSRAQICDDMFSAQVQASDIDRLENDDAVDSISLSRPLPLIE